MSKRYNNYHKHDHYSNIATIDSIAKPEDYIKRALELGHTTYFTTQHGWQGNIFEAYTLCQKHGLKCMYGVEAYYVDDMYDTSNRRNYHIIIIPLTKNAMKQVNKLLSKANIDGYYYKARVDLNGLLSLNPKEVVITTACIASRLFKTVEHEIEYFDLTEKEREILKEKGIFRNLYGNADKGYYELEKDILDGKLSKEEAIIINNPYESYIIDYRVLPSKKRNVKKEIYKNGWLNEFFLPIFNHFKENLYLEVQNHNNYKQIEYNKKILELHKKYGVKLIHANDSHYIFPDDSKYRDMFLKAKNINYPEEEGFILDYPDYDTVVKRYKEQGVLNDEEIKEALESTLVFDNAEPIVIDKDIKLPKIIDGDSNEYLKNLLLESFNKEISKGNIDLNRLDEYKEAVKYEYEIVEKCNMADYFILNNKIVDLAVNKYGAILTRSGRGSAPSFYINRLLGFTKIDRLKSPIKLYPTRFMSAERILLSRSLPD